MRNLLFIFCFLLSSICVNAQTTAFSETFESTNSLTLVNGTQTNKWFRGSANQCDGTFALYISNNSSSYAYTNTSTSTVHAYFDVAIPSGATNIQILFRRKLNGEASYDYLQTWSCVNSFAPTAGTLISSNANRVLLGTLQGVTTCATTTYNVANSVAGTTRRFIFTWRNDASGGTNPPALIDNIIVRYTPAPTPPPNDACSGSTNLPCATSNLAGTTVGSVSETVPPGISTSQYGVWYTFSGNGQQTTISSTAVFDHEMALYYGTGCGSLSLITSVDNQLSNTAEVITFVTVSGVTYWVWVSHYLSGSTTTGTFTISRTCTTITDGPCINTFSGVTESMPIQSSPLVISTCPTNGAFPDEYMTWNGAVSGTPYVVSSSQSSDWITVRRSTPNGTVEASGVSPLSWVSSFSGTIYIHINSNGACATIDNFGCRNITVERISALPVELIYLTATPYPTFNKINWATASESNSDYFEIQKSLDGIEWKVCGTKSASGNSNEEIKYSILDAIQEFGIHYYRLKQVDYNGDFKIYGPIAVNNPNLIDKKPIKYFNSLGQEINLDNHYGVYIILYDDGTIQKSYK